MEVLQKSMLTLLLKSSLPICLRHHWTQVIGLEYSPIPRRTQHCWFIIQGDVLS